MPDIMFSPCKPCCSNIKPPPLVNRCICDPIPSGFQLKVTRYKRNIGQSFAPYLESDTSSMTYYPTGPATSASYPTNINLCSGGAGFYSPVAYCNDPIFSINGITRLSEGWYSEVKQITNSYSNIVGEYFYVLTCRKSSFSGGRMLDIFVFERSLLSYYYINLLPPYPPDTPEWFKYSISHEKYHIGYFLNVDENTSCTPFCVKNMFIPTAGYDENERGYTVELGCGSSPPLSMFLPPTINQNSLKNQKENRESLKKELVVSRYNENLTWLDQTPADWHKTVYNKGEELIPGSIQLPNTGREAGTYLDHIVKHYSDLAEWTCFTQAKHHNRTDEEFFSRLETPYSDTTGLTSEYDPHFPSDDIKSLDIIEIHGNWEVHYGIANPIRESWCDAANMPMDMLWNSVFDCPMPDPVVFCYGAQWAAPRHRITDRPLSFWKDLRDKVNSVENTTHAPSNTPYNAWHLEMIWKYLFGDVEKFPVKGGH